MPLMIIKSGREIRPGWPAPLLPPGHYGCGLGCDCFTGTLSAFEERECICQWLGLFLPEALERDLLNGDEEKLALHVLEIIEPLQLPFSLLQKTLRDALASLSLVASDEILPLEPTNRHPESFLI